MDARERNEIIFCRSLPNTGVFSNPMKDMPDIIVDSNYDADHIDIIRDMKAMGYFDDEC